jgi:hypothetical protein
MHISVSKLGAWLLGVVVAALVGYTVVEGQLPPGIQKAWEGISDNAWASALAIVLLEVVLIATVWALWRRQATPDEMRPSTGLLALAGAGQLCVFGLVTLALIAHIDSPSPQGQDLLGSISDRVAHDCELRDPKEGGSESPYQAIRRAVALISCTPTGSGASGFSAARFASDDAAEAFFNEWFRYYQSPAGTCEGGSGSLPWADQQGIVKGKMICGSVGDENRILWTDRATRTVFGASSRNSADALHGWWSDRIRPPSAFTDRAQRSLRRLASPIVDTSRCSRDSETDSPLGIASLSCASPQAPDGNRLGANSFFLTRFRAESQLDAHWTSLVNAWGLSAKENDSEFCDTAPLVKGFWDSGNHLKGRILCFPASGSQWIAWTLDNRRFYGLVGRDDQSVSKTYRAWERLADIGLVN